MASLDQIRKEVFSFSLLLVGGVPPEKIELVSNQVVGASNVRLTQLQQSIALDNNTLVMLWANIGQNTLSQLQQQNLFNIATHLIVAFDHSNTERNLNADMQGEGLKENIQMVITDKKTIGRKPKYATEEERKEAKKKQTLASNRKRRAEIKGKGNAQSGVEGEQPVGIITGNAVDTILALLSDEDIVRLFGGLFEGASAVNPNLIYTLGTRRFQLNDDQYARMRVRIIKLKEKVMKKPKSPTNRKNLFKDPDPEGTGVFEDISNAVKKTYVSVVSKAKKAVSSATKYANVLVQGRNDYPPKVRKIIGDFGTKVIKSAIVRRTPVPSVLTQALNAVSLGSFSKNLKDSPYDTLFHLSLVVELDDGSKILIEKNEVINMDKNPSLPAHTDIQEVPNIPSRLTLNAMLQNAQNRMGDKYFTYSARDNNCQDYIMAILQANNMGNDATSQFVKQDTKQLFEGLTTLRKVSNTITDIGAKVNEITTGAGFKRERARKGDSTRMPTGRKSRKPAPAPTIEDLYLELQHFFRMMKRDGASDNAIKQYFRETMIDRDIDPTEVEAGASQLFDMFSSRFDVETGEYTEEKVGKGVGIMSVNEALKLAGEIAGGIGGFVLLDRLYRWAYNRFQNNQAVPVPIAQLLNERNLALPEAEVERTDPTQLADVEMGRGFNPNKPPAIISMPDETDQDLRDKIAILSPVHIDLTRRVYLIKANLDRLKIIAPEDPQIAIYEQQLIIGRDLLLRQGNMLRALEQELRGREGRGLKNVIDFEDMKWGSLTKQVEAYNKQHNTKLDLHSFSMMVLANPDKYIERTKKRARFYINVINKKTIKNNISNNNITIMPKKAMKGGDLQVDIYQILSRYKWFMDLDQATKTGTLYGVMDAVKRDYNGNPNNIPNMKQFLEEVKKLITPVAEKVARDPKTKYLYDRGFGLYAGADSASRGTGMMHPTHTIIHYYGGHSMRGGDIGDMFRNAFDPNRNGVAEAFTPQAIEQAFQPITSTFQPVVEKVKNFVPDIIKTYDPNQNGLTKVVKQRIVNPARKAFRKDGEAEKLGKKTASALIHQGIPAVSGYLGSMIGNTLAPETMGVAGLLGSQVGTQLGKMGADELGKATGYGVGRKGRFVKGSQEAKDYMASLRAKKNA
jgi:hypothetical protein